MDNKTRLLLLGLLLVGVIVANVGQAADSNYSWKKLDDYLCNKGHDSDSYAKLARDRLEKLRGSSSCVSFSRDTKMLAALERLEEYRLVTEQGKCDRESRTFIKSFRAEVRQYDALDMTARLYSKDTAEKCQQANVQLYIEKKENSPHLSEIITRLQYFFMELAFNAVEYHVERRYRIIIHAPEDYIKWAHEYSMVQRLTFQRLISRNEPLATGINADIAYDAIENLATRGTDLNDIEKHITWNERERLVITPESAVELFNLWIIDSCKIFVQEFGPAVFDFSEEDLYWLKRSSALLEDQHNDQVSEYYFAWAQYKGCLQLINDREDREKLLGYLSEIAGIMVTIRADPRASLDFEGIGPFGIPDLRPHDFKVTRAIDFDSFTHKIRIKHRLQKVLEEAGETSGDHQRTRAN